MRKCVRTTLGALTLVVTSVETADEGTTDVR